MATGHEDSTLDDAWHQAIEILKNRGMLPASQLAFIRITKPIGMINDTVLLANGSEFGKEFLETRARDALTTALSIALEQQVRFAVTVDPELDDQSLPAVPTTKPDYEFELHRYDGEAAPTEPRDDAAVPGSEHSNDGRLHQEDASRPGADARAGAESRTHGAGTAAAAIDPHARLNRNYTFDTFVIGASNRFAHAAATAVAEAPAKAYNPLFIYGQSGLGKTHLLHAIGHYAQNLYPGVRIRYVMSEEFTNDFINSIRDDRAEEFQRRYREVDVLLIDDIQFLQGKEQTMEEFFHTFNTLHNDAKQVVITSDLPPKHLNGFEDRMRSRFEWGLLTDVQPPDLETRIAILRKKASAEDISAPDDVLEYIASKISSNIRELEGALIRVTAFANLNRQSVEMSLAEMVLKDLITDTEATEITPSTIMAQTSSYFSVSIDALCSADRSRVLVNARQIAMYLCRELTDLSLPKIGQLFGNRDHTTVMHAYRKIAQQMAAKHATFNQVTELTNRIKQQSA